MNNNFQGETWARVNYRNNLSSQNNQKSTIKDERCQ